MRWKGNSETHHRTTTSVLEPVLAHFLWTQSSNSNSKGLLALIHAMQQPFERRMVKQEPEHVCCWDLQSASLENMLLTFESCIWEHLDAPVDLRNLGCIFDHGKTHTPSPSLYLFLSLSLFPPSCSFPIRFSHTRTLTPLTSQHCCGTCLETLSRTQRLVSFIWNTTWLGGV